MSLLNEASSRQKRVLPSRARRGGPGIGSCDVDIMILDVQKRKSESDPLIPASTRFMLTTNTELVPSAPAGPFQLNAVANNLYFDKPEVMKSFKDHLEIQTPEFTQLAEDAFVTSRFRNRQVEEEPADTSDATYEKRHRKYETFEKRQRLREKEKLKHEQYKLKERIDQLRGMDNSSFLAVPASSFSPHPGHVDDQPIPDDIALASLPGAHVNGAAAYNEGERRRKEMLDTAAILEERYRILLPPERRHQERAQRVADRRALDAEQGEVSDEAELHGQNPDVEMEVPEEPAKLEPEPAEEEPIPFGPAPKPKLRVRLKMRIDVPDVPPNYSVPPAVPPPLATAGPDPVISRAGKAAAQAPIPPHSPKYIFRDDAEIDDFPLEEVDQLQDDEDNFVPAGPSKRKSSKKKKTAPSASVAPIPNTRVLEEAPAFHESISAPPARQRTKSVRSRTPKPAPPPPCSILVAAHRNAEGISTRKTQRYNMAFGIKIPENPFPAGDFETSPWILANCDVDHDESNGGPPESLNNSQGTPVGDIFPGPSATPVPREMSIPPIADLRTTASGRVIESESPPPGGQEDMLATPLPLPPAPVKRSRGRPSRSKAAIAEREAAAAEAAAQGSIEVDALPIVAPVEDAEDAEFHPDAGKKRKRSSKKPIASVSAIDPETGEVIEPPKKRRVGRPNKIRPDAPAPRQIEEAPSHDNLYSHEPISANGNPGPPPTSSGFFGPGGRSLDSPERLYSPPSLTNRVIVNGNGVPPPPPPLPEKAYISPTSSRNRGPSFASLSPATRRRDEASLVDGGYDAPYGNTIYDAAVGGHFALPAQDPVSVSSLDRVGGAERSVFRDTSPEV